MSDTKPPCPLFTPIALRDLTLSNRIVVSPLCQYSAVEGSAQPWHWMHAGSLAISGAGLLILEATGVAPDGRISPQCLGLYSDANEAALTRLLKDVRTYSDMPIGIQLCHAGRKGSTRPTWELWRGHVVPAAEGGWPVVAPSALPYMPDWDAPMEMDAAALSGVKQAFVDATVRAGRCGFDMIELHAAHGYLLHSFVSPLTNRRTDGYGGGLEGRARYPLEIFRAMRAAWPEGKPLGIRITGEDWIEGGLTLGDAVEFARMLKEVGVDYVTPSAGQLAPGMVIPPVGPGYMAHFAERVKREAGVVAMAVGMIVTPEQANGIVASGDADMTAVGRGFLDDPRWGWRAAHELGETVSVAPQYHRATPKFWPPYAAVHGRAAGAAPADALGLHLPQRA